MNPVNAVNIFNIPDQKSILPGLIDCKMDIDSKKAANALKNKGLFEYIIRGSSDKNMYCTITFNDAQRKVQHFRCSTYDDFAHKVAKFYRYRNQAIKKHQIPLTTSQAVKQLLNPQAVKPQAIKPQVKPQAVKPQAKPQAIKPQAVKPGDLPEFDLVSYKGKTIPKYAISKTGIISTAGFMKWLSEQPQSQKEDLLKWYFEQRKFPCLGQACFLISPKMKLLDGDLSGRICDAKEGYALSAYPGSVASLTFIEDKLIDKVYPCKSVRMLTAAIPMGFYEDGKVMIQQQAIRSCVPTCAAMLLVERGKKCNSESIKTTDLAKTEDFIRWIEEGGLKANLVKGNPDVHALKEIIKKNGSISCSIGDKVIGGHQIILDQIDNDYAIIRDPYHGRRIRIPTSKFMDIAPSEYIYITDK